MNIVTLTVNPALDKSAKVDGLVPNDKLKCHSLKYQPGGGGINITRVLKRLELETNCIFPSGGNAGVHLKDLLLKENIEPISVPVDGWTRENLSVVDTQNGLQYRFGMPGNTLLEKELNTLENLLKKSLNTNDILVLSGSLAEGIPIDYYSKLIKAVASKKVKIVIDTSGSALKEVLKENVYLIKPNQRELAQLAGKEFLSSEEQEAFALELIKSKKAKYVVVSLGARGAFIASEEGIHYQATPSL
ncbi:1-phosphofructokinase family hexose kinase [Maribacter arcticus]|uniref:6-phosphofructokinase 2 n=1 Tax=Maribacter arcticus TaxID=561365 RepID=A0A1T5CHH6_9FLAO|nr:1-phosphofructokinase family hexose kinase [Maribacter arcticus]SKB58945.1 6-phosphofructokinase 2 [Maribacter arcticus]